jgi:hypothetical protein
LSFRAIFCFINPNDPPINPDYRGFTVMRRWFCGSSFMV